MYAVLGHAVNNKERVSRDFAIFHSLLERKYINSPSTSFCSVVHNPKEFSFSVISESSNIQQEIQDFASRYFMGCAVTPNVTLTLTISPQF